MTLPGCLCSDPPGASFEVGNDLGNGQGLFRIRIEFQIPSRKSSPELGSDYGTKPSRSFHEETVYPHCPGNRAHLERIPQRVCQRVHQHASPRLVRNTDRKLGLLRRRSGWASGNGRRSLCSGLGQHASQYGNVDRGLILLWRRSGWASGNGRRSLCSGLGQHASQYGNVDRGLILLWRRSGRASGNGRRSLCSGLGQHASQYGNVDRGLILLRRRSGRASGNGRRSLCSGLGQHASQYGNVDRGLILLWRRSGRASGNGRRSLCSGSSANCNPPALALVGRLSVRRDGQ